VPVEYQPRETEISSPVSSYTEQQNSANFGDSKAVGTKDVDIPSSDMSPFREPPKYNDLISTTVLVAESNAFALEADSPDHGENKAMMLDKDK
jgi:hypothetical protein